MQVSWFCMLVAVLLMITPGRSSDIGNNGLEEGEATPAPLEKKGRFVSFNNEHGEVKIELDFAVPFMKIPVQSKKLGGTHGDVIEPLIELNAKGLVTVATMLFFLVTVVPKMVKLFIPQAHATVTDGLMPLMSRIDEALHSMNIPSKECYQRSACWFGGSTVINPSLIDGFSPEWLKNVLSNPEIQGALNKGQNGEDCSVYKCSIPLQTMSKLLSIGKNMLNSDQ